MDILPVKFRSPPPKPPRRRHSDQLSLSPSGTLPSSRKKYFDGNECNISNIQRSPESTSYCGSLPPNWTPDCSFEENFESLPLFNEQDYSLNQVHLSQKCKLLEETIFNKHKNGLEKIDLSGNKNRVEKFQSLNKTFDIHPVLKLNILTSTDSKKSDVVYTDSSNLNVKTILNTKYCNFPSAKVLSKETHRRHNSDPLPLNFICSNLGFSQSSPLDINKKIFNFEHICESREHHCLLQEINSWKEINHKLWEHISLMQVSLDSVKRSLVDKSNVVSVSDLYSNLYDSLRAKDHAMEERMKVILQERDAAIQDLENIVQVLAGSFEDNCTFEEDKVFDKEVKQLLKEIEVTCSPMKLLQQQRLLLSYLYRSKELKQDVVLHEMKLTAAERDNLKIKVNLLEEELNSLKLSNEIWSTDNKYWENNLLNTLNQVIHQRDVAIKNYNGHSMEYFSSRSTLNEKSFDSDDLNDCLQKFDGTVTKRKLFQSSQNDIRKCPSFSLRSKSDEIRYLKEEILVLNKSLELERKKKENAEEKCIRLDRLVNVLQKKINLQSVGIPV